MNKEAALEKQLNEAGVPEKARPAFKQMFKDFGSLNQGDKLFLRNQLNMKVEEAAEDFMLAISLWKRNGGGMTEWQFVLQKTDEEIAAELGIPSDEELEDDKASKEKDAKS